MSRQRGAKGCGAEASPPAADAAKCVSRRSVQHRTGGDKDTRVLVDLCDAPSDSPTLPPANMLQKSSPTAAHRPNEHFELQRAATWGRVEACAGRRSSQCGVRGEGATAAPAPLHLLAPGLKRATLGPSTPSLPCAFLSPHHHTQSASMKPITLYTVGTPSEHRTCASLGTPCSRLHAPQTARRSAFSSRN